MRCAAKVRSKGKNRSFLCPDHYNIITIQGSKATIICNKDRLVLLASPSAKRSDDCGEGVLADEPFVELVDGVVCSGIDVPEGWLLVDPAVLEAGINGVSGRMEDVGLDVEP